MYFLESGCSSNLKPIITIVGWVVFLIQMGIPIALIVLGMLDLGKAVIASKEDEIKKAKKAFGQRFLYAAAVFLVVWAVKLVMGWLPGIFNNTNDKNDPANITTNNAWQDCWRCIAARGKEGKNNCVYTTEDDEYTAKLKTSIYLH